MAVLLVTLALVGLAAASAVPVNQPPVAMDDEVLVMGYTDYLEIPVFANDWDPDGNTLEVIAVIQVDCGKAILLKGGAVGITPDWSLAHHDDLARPALIAHGSYIISDGQLESKAQWFVWH